MTTMSANVPTAMPKSAVTKAVMRPEMLAVMNPAGEKSSMRINRITIVTAGMMTASHNEEGAHREKKLQP